MVLALALAAGCADAPEAGVGVSRAAVQNGTPSDVAGVVWVGDAGEFTACVGVVVGDRWVIIPGFCTDGVGTFVSLGEDLRGGPWIDALRVHEGPAISSGATEASVSLVEMPEALGVAPVELSEATPAVDDIYTIIGFGEASNPAGDVRTEGAFRIIAVDADSFTTEPEGDVAACNDQPVFDPDGRLAGINLFGYQHDTYPACFSRSIAMRVSVFRDFVESTVGVAPDAGAPPADAGPSPTDDGGGAAGNAGTPSAAQGDEGGCVAAGVPSPSRGTAALSLAVGLVVLLRRRRR